MFQAGINMVLLNRQSTAAARCMGARSAVCKTIALLILRLTKRDLSHIGAGKGTRAAQDNTKAPTVYLERGIDLYRATYP